jgi:carbonic anhydrase/acetyltransferase-like protein (isoleucine patch superfamily)
LFAGSLQSIGRMPLVPYLEHTPKISDDSFIAPNAWLTGKVTVESKASVFFGVSARGDIQAIHIGKESNIQDNAVIHTSRGLKDCIIGSRVTVGHCAILHGCTVNDSVIIGMGSTVLDNAEIGSNCIIGANSLVTMNTKIPEGSLALGSPAKVIRKLTIKEIDEIQAAAESYLKVSARYKEFFKN